MSEQFLDFLDEHFDPDFMVSLMRAANKMRVTDFHEAITLAVKDAARDNRITLTNLSMIELKTIKLNSTKGYRSDDAYVNEMIHLLFTSLKNDGTIPDSIPIPKKELKS